MRYLLDTSVVINFLKNKDLYLFYKEKLSLNINNTYLSVVTKGELLSLSKRRNWGFSKIKEISLFFKEANIIDIEFYNEGLHEAYAQIDAYSQGKIINGKKLKGSSKTMGKNDLWIAASAMITDAILITTDKDFDYLDGKLLNRIYIPPK